LQVYGKKWWELEELREEKAKFEKEYDDTYGRPLIFEHFWHLYDVNKKVDAINYYEAKIENFRAKNPLLEPV
jgi:hypothetical protein